ncbi:MlaD family protein [Flavilitoribacter nigricans]|uniref:ABC transporter permease n=1 Tax=Flavilitoribacter nigricans (strain ATCC 23147 / DSM 23189 / NBRC 102662 / NCIMB 1420 / SS-2) TaxID=1122177 RepID=A0A2D0NBD8_FLAN2|nr:MlaD family protein [Flavilitoribacter nigricans]PHN05706.1 ABC transporter permease [Flavilitoribacter nigricans DSM 23189 = NBRC 102662]
MRKEHVNTFKLGLFVTTAVVLFVVAIYFIGNDQNLFQPTFQLHAVFNNAEGLRPGNNVRYAGIDAGTVKKILITSDSTVTVVMSLHREMQNYIKKDAVASIGSDGLVGNRILNISPKSVGNGAADLVEDQDVIQSYSRIATDDMLEVLGKTNENIALFSLQLLKISEKINKGSGTMNMLLQDESLAADLRQSVANLKYTTWSLREMGSEMHNLVAGLEDGDGLLHRLLYDTTIMANVEGVSLRMDSLLSRDISPIVANLEDASRNIAGSSRSVQSLLESIESGEGPIGSLLRDTVMDADLKVTLANIQESSERFKENMEAMRHNFLFRGYFRKMEKIEKKSLKE